MAKRRKSIGKSIQSVAPVSAGRGFLPQDIMLLSPETIRAMPQPYDLNHIRAQMKLTRRVSPLV